MIPNKTDLQPFLLPLSLPPSLALALSFFLSGKQESVLEVIWPRSKWACITPADNQTEGKKPLKQLMKMAAAQVWHRVSADVLRM